MNIWTELENYKNVNTIHVDSSSKFYENKASIDLCDLSYKQLQAVTCSIKLMTVDWTEI